MAKPTKLGNGVGHIYREGDLYVAYFHEDGRYRYGSDQSYETLRDRMISQGFTEVINMAHNHSQHVADQALDAFMAPIERRKIRRRK